MTIGGDQATNNPNSDFTVITPIRPSPSIPSSPVNRQRAGTKLPSVLLTNLQSFGMSEGKDKSTELEAILNINKIDIACLTETWLTDTTKKQISIGNYTHFLTVKKEAKRASGGVSILVNENFVARELDVKVPEHIESIWLSTRPNWLPRSISVIIIAGIYYPGSRSIYAPEQEDIILHLTETVNQLLKKKYVNPLFIIMGDFNDL